jgi:hypothetical protein
MATGGFGNPVVATAELVAALAFTVLALIMPFLALLAAVLVILLSILWWKRRRAARRARGELRRGPGAEAPLHP